MAKAIRYYCPADEKQLLLEEKIPTREFRSYKMMIPERPLTCPICKKSYYKRECIRREE